jgi:large subunit ribosomal protein L29
MKIEEIRKKNTDELKNNLIQIKKQMFNLRFQKANSTLQSTAQLRASRRDVARIKTVLTERATEK